MTAKSLHGVSDPLLDLKIAVTRPRKTIETHP